MSNSLKNYIDSSPTAYALVIFAAVIGFLAGTTSLALNLIQIQDRVIEENKSVSATINRISLPSMSDYPDVVSAIISKSPEATKIKRTPQAEVYATFFNPTNKPVTVHNIQLRLKIAGTTAWDRLVHYAIVNESANKSNLERSPIAIPPGFPEPALIVFTFIPSKADGHYDAYQLTWRDQDGKEFKTEQTDIQPNTVFSSMYVPNT